MPMNTVTERAILDDSGALDVMIETIFMKVVRDRPQPDRPDRRTMERLSVLMPARVVTSDPELVHPCIIRDLSLAGARIGISRNARLSSQFTLQIDHQRVRQVRLCWRRADAAGLAFC
jgi:hypothetical protein